MAITRLNQPRRSSVCSFTPPKSIRHPSPSMIIGQKLCNATNGYYNSIKFTESKVPASVPQPPTQKFQEPLIDCEIPSISITACKENDAAFIVEPLPPLPLVSSPDFEKIYRDKIRVCSHIFNFQNQQAEKSGKKIKLESLIEIEHFFQRKKDVQSMSPALLKLAFDMIYMNIFDQDPLILKKCSVQPVGNITDPSWVHLSHVFTIFSSFIKIFPNDKNINLDLAKKTIVLMNLPDANVRENLSIFLKSYIQLHEEHIQDIVVFTKTVLQNVVDEIYTPHCVSPILSFLVPIFKANKPLSSELNSIIIEAIYPLFRCKDLSLFTKSINYFLSHILEKERGLQGLIIDRILKTFPTQNGTKQPMYVTALVSVLKIVSSKVLPLFINRILCFLKKCIESPNSKVAESALKMWTGQRISSFLVQNYKMAIPTLLPAVLETMTFHWDKQIQDLAINASAAMRRLNAQIYTNVLKDITEKAESQTCDYNENDILKNWATISRIAAHNDRTIDLNKMLQQAHRSFIKEGAARRNHNRKMSLASFIKPNNDKNIPVNKASTMSQTLCYWDKSLLL